MKPKCSLILLSGGQGSRCKTKTPKQYLPLCGKPVILHSLTKILTFGEIAEVIVVCDPEYQPVFSPFPVRFARPGSHRQQSVLSGLQETTSPWVCVHDGARPFIYASEVSQLIQAAQNTGAATLVSPIPYTIKQRDPVKTWNKEDFVCSHTPQCVKTDLLLQGLRLAEKEGRTLTDDVEAAEILGIQTALVPITHPQIKITYPEDFYLAEAILQYNEGNQGMAL